ncbi:SRPBCC family protein [Microbacterium amylolyticum]|uniref:Polyketide cyclase n=2 Tax=Microbacterium amylolyticum TaxID=936337 RepID=A0ABS4ZI09_9MICO|nr:SRPBCC family protein [Microbacterium amylolyticum]MBP2436914.1 hypothetical protein [Microbacterium amylolyticum]
MQSRHVSVVVRTAPERVYAFAAQPGNLRRWAAGLAQADVQERGEDLVLQSPMGEVTVRFVPHNDFGVLDHAVTLPSGTTVNNPLRVVAHPDGSEVIFTVRQIELTDEEFDRDCRLVAEDLDRLRAILEG